MQIAPGIEAEKWKELSLDDPDSPDWSVGIDILKARINQRFIEPIDYLIASEGDTPATYRSFGFTVLAIDCLVIETLQAFIEGLEDTDGISRATFRKFLTTRRGFATDFTEALANTFYSDFRCGILHQAEIGGEGKVWTVGPLIKVNGNAITVNRNLFHETLKTEFNGYLAELQDTKNLKLRDSFRKKMNFISRA